MGIKEPMLSPNSERLLRDLIERFPELSSAQEQITRAFLILKETFANDGKLLVCGNGGSAADAEHISGELLKGFLKKRPLSAGLSQKIKAVSGEANWVEQLQGSLPVIPLVNNGPLISALGNDLAFDLVYAQQVLGYGAPGDTLLAISTSGSSTNVIRGVIVAKSMGLQTIGLTGISGGLLKDLADVTIRAPSNETFRIQEYHLPIYHLLAAMLEEEFF